MAQSVKLSDDVMSLVHRESALQNRSVAEQVTHWINIGRAIEQSSTFDYTHVTAALKAALSPDELSAEEREVWFAQFAAATVKPTNRERALHAERKKLGRGVGMTDGGELVYQSFPAE